MQLARVPAVFASLTSHLCLAASGNEWQKDRQFHALNAEAELVEVKAVRGGRECLVTNTDVVVGDVLLVDTGDRVVADGIVVEAHGLSIDEARAPTLAHTLSQGFRRRSAWVPWSTASLLRRPDRQLTRAGPGTWALLHERPAAQAASVWPCVRFLCAMQFQPGACLGARRRGMGPNRIYAGSPACAA